MLHVCVVAFSRQRLRASGEFGERSVASRKELEAYNVQCGMNGILDLFVETMVCVGELGAAEVMVPTRLLKGKRAQFIYQVFRVVFWA